MTAHDKQSYIQLLNRIENQLDSDTVYLPAEFKNGGFINLIAGETKTKMAISHETENITSYRNGRKVVFTETIHKGESNFKKQQDVAHDGEYVDECRPGAANVMNVHTKFYADKRKVIPLEELPPVIQSYGRMVKRNRSDIDKWDSILSKAIKEARPLIRKNNNQAPQTGSGATESIVQVGAGSSGIAKQLGELSN